jgi:glutathionylspermidine synthase
MWLFNGGGFERLHIPQWFIPRIEASWKLKEPDIYGRFDLVYASPQHPPKMLEYNADTPTSLLESSVIQYDWLQAQFPQGDQFNSIHTALVQRWQTIAQQALTNYPVHFTYVADQWEDLGNTDYMRATAEQAGLSTIILAIENIGWDERLRQFVDEQNEVIHHLFKLYPWEWLLDDPYGAFLADTAMRIHEPAWKLVLSNKAILPILWELFPGHPNLLPAYTSPERLMGQYVKKPAFSREGANIEICQGDPQTLICSGGPYDQKNSIYQALYPLPCFDGNYTVIGSWVIGGKAAGIGIREDKSLITKDTSRFIPHRIG